MSNRKIALKLNISKDTVNKYVKEMNELTKLIELEKDSKEIIKLQEQLVNTPTRRAIQKDIDLFLL